MSESLAELRHELRTPINHILGYSEMLIEDAQDASSPLLPGLQEVHAAGKHLLEILNEALAPSRTEVSDAERADLHDQLQHPIETIQEACANLQEQAANGASDLETLGDDLPKIAGAAARLRQMAKEKLLGEPAEPPKSAPASGDQPPPEPTASSPATSAESLANQQGVAADRTGRPTLPARLHTGPDHLLVVDDNETNRDMLGRRLEREGYKISTAIHGKQALDKLKTESFDLVLLDIMMPEMDGYQVLAAMKAEAKWRDLPVIMISALDEIQSVVRCIEMGAEDYLPKPFDPVLLRARIGACLEKKHLRDLERQKTIELEDALRKLRATQDQLIVQEKLASLGALTAGIAHEIKNPLNFVTNFAALSNELMEELGETLPGKVDESINADVDDILGNLKQNMAKINEHSKRADSIVRGMLEHSRGQKGERRKADLNALVAEYVNLAYHGLRGQDNSFNVTLDKQLDPSIGEIEIVPQDLSRVILNLANNACYAANEKKKALGESFAPTVRVTTKNLGDKVELRIRDNGNGVPPAIQQKVFQPFFTTKPTGSGTGLGLSISYDIVVQGHQGQLKLETEEGQFAEFIVVLPK